MATQKELANPPGRMSRSVCGDIARLLHKSGFPVRDSLIWAGSFDRKKVARIRHKGLFKPTGRPSALFATNGVTGLEAWRSIAAGLEDSIALHAGGP